MTKIITAKEAAKILGLSVGYVTSYLLQTGKVKAQKINGQWVVDRESVEAYEKPVNTKPVVRKAMTVKASTANKEENHQAIEAQMEAVRAGRVKPLILGRGVREI